MQRVNGSYVLRCESENIVPTDGAKLMMHRIVSNSERMESFVVQENVLNDGHRCGACHNVSDAKVRMINRNQDVGMCLSISYLLLTV